jgi:hypothetical protein
MAKDINSMSATQLMTRYSKILNEIHSCEFAIKMHQTNNSDKVRREQLIAKHAESLAIAKAEQAIVFPLLITKLPKP